MRGPRKSTSLHGVLTLDFDPTKFQLDKRKENESERQLLGRATSVLKRLAVIYTICDVYVMLFMPTSEWIFWWRGTIAAAGRGLGRCASP